MVETSGHSIPVLPSFLIVLDIFEKKIIYPIPESPHPFQVSPSSKSREGEEKEKDDELDKGQEMRGASMVGRAALVPFAMTTAYKLPTEPRRG